MNKYNSWSFFNKVNGLYHCIPFDVTQARIEQKNLKELLLKTTGVEDLQSITKIKLRVIANEVGLQNLNIYTPNLTALTLDGSQILSLRDLGCSLQNLKILRVNNCSLTSLDGLYGLENLEELYASDNEIADVLSCSCLTKVKTIDFRRNRINCISSLGIFTLCVALENLYLRGNKGIENTKNYRHVIKNLIPHLKTLDGRPLLQEDLEQKICEEHAERTSESNLKNHIKTKDKKRPMTTENTNYLVTFPPKPLSLRPQSANATFSTELRNICSESAQQNVPSLLTSGAPICGNFTTALRRRLQNIEAWPE